MSLRKFDMGPSGHFGIAFAAKTLAPQAPLWIFLVASEALDLLSFGFEAVGLEQFAVSQTDYVHGVQVLAPGSVPYSHGLVMSILWSILFGAVAFAFFRDHRTSVILGMVVFSHWILDFIVHLPDLPLFLEGSPLLGLGLWGSGPGLIASGILEFALLAGGFAIYFVFRKRNQPRVFRQT
jgi:hypothetical protein